LHPGQRTTLPAVSGSAFSCISHDGHLNFTISILLRGLKTGNNPQFRVGHPQKPSFPQPQLFSIVFDG
jgi:hypothetical protein